MMKKTLKVITQKMFLKYWRISILVGITAFAAGAAQAQKATTDAEQAAREKRAEKMALNKTIPKTISITELRQRNAAVKPSQSNAQQAPVAGTKKVEPGLQNTAPAKTDTKNDPRYQSRTATGSAGKPAAKATTAGSSSTSGSQNPIQ